MRRHLLGTAVLALVAGLGHAADRPLSSGIDRQYMESSIRPQDDFYHYMSDKWEKTVQIPPDMPLWGSFVELDKQTKTQMRELVERAAAARAADGTDAQRIGDFYASFMDEARVEQLGVAPLRAELDRIAAVRDLAALAALLGHLARIGVAVPFDAGVHQDNHDATRYVVEIGQGGLAMPDRDYYVAQDDAKLADTRAKYLAHAERTLRLAGDADAAAHARAILDFETALAAAQWTQVDLRDPVKGYNKVAVADLAKLAPQIDWQPWLAATGIRPGVRDVIVGQPSYLKAVGALAARTPLDTWKAYLALHLLDAYSPYLSQAFADENFDFYGRTLEGSEEDRPRWRRALAALEEAQGEALGKLYVEAHFPAERKRRIETMVGNLMTAYRQRIAKLDWMGAATKKEAQAKLAKFTYKIGYPDVWRDYSALKVARDDLAGNVMRAREFAYQRQMDKPGRPIDRDEWTMTPQTINCYYNPEQNVIVFPAAILQPPFFDPDAEDAVNYGAIGAVIGHEMSHGFDDTGSQYDGDGNLRNWWTAADHRRFEAKGKVLAAQFGAFEPVPGYHVNGRLTLGENIADNSGLAIAEEAYRISLHGKPSPVIDGFTGAQRFYMGWAQVWRRKERQEFAIQLLKADTHAPDRLRVQGTLRNEAGFYDAFGVRPGDKMYLAPRNRVSFW